MFFSHSRAPIQNKMWVRRKRITIFRVHSAGTWFTTYIHLSRKHSHPCTCNLMWKYLDYALPQSRDLPGFKLSSFHQLGTRHSLKKSTWRQDGGWDEGNFLESKDRCACVTDRGYKYGAPTRRGTSIESTT